MHSSEFVQVVSCALFERAKFKFKTANQNSFQTESGVSSFFFSCKLYKLVFHIPLLLLVRPIFFISIALYIPFARFVGQIESSQCFLQVIPASSLTIILLKVITNIIIK